MKIITIKTLAVAAALSLSSFSAQAGYFDVEEHLLIGSTVPIEVYEATQLQVSISPTPENELGKMLDSFLQEVVYANEAANKCTEASHEQNIICWAGMQKKVFTLYQHQAKLRRKAMNILDHWKKSAPAGMTGIQSALTDWLDGVVGHVAKVEAEPSTEKVPAVSEAVETSAAAAIDDAIGAGEPLSEVEQLIADGVAEKKAVLPVGKTPTPAAPTEEKPEEDCD